ncbi:MAG TPA: TIGR04255 family protein [Planctomycetota bacterium]|nr:TIGR04255 family protein [Planctomycetota bacterium]
MSRKYANPPIIEAVCEFRLSPETPWDPTIAGLLYEKLKDEFPRKDHRPIRQLSAESEKERTAPRIPVEDRALFFATDDKSLVQVGSRLLSVNCLKPYPSWNVFHSKISKALEALQETVAIKGFQTIRLRYIDRIEIPGTKVELDDYFDFAPRVGNNLPRELAAFFVGCLVSFSEGRDACRIELTNAVPEREGHSAYRLTTEYFLDEAGAVTPEKALAWLEQAHEAAGKIFEGCIKDALREIFDGTE